MEIGQLNDYLNKARKKAEAVTAECYIEGCGEKVISSHSISKARYLSPVSKDGNVFTVDLKIGPSFSLRSIGKNKATVFPGFCGTHDRMFFPIDNKPYREGDLEQQFLFAFRAAAREYFARAGAIETSKHMREAVEKGRFGFGTNLRQEEHDAFMAQFQKGFSDMGQLRGRLNTYWKNKKFSRLHTYVIKASPAIPMAASSVFHVELNPAGSIVTDVRAKDGLLRPCHFTVFPQGGITYLLITVDIRDKGRYDWLSEYEHGPNINRQLLISNLLVNHVENFAINPDYWEGLPEQVRNDFAEHFPGSLTTGHLINSAGEPNVNLFAPTHKA